MKSFYDLSAKLIDGGDFDFDQLRGFPVLVVNIASKCGLTESGYKTMAGALAGYGKYQAKVLAFPCRQFLGQEFEDTKQIQGFVDKKLAAVKEQFGKDFFLFAPVEVNGESASPVFEFLKENSSLRATGGDSVAPISWNFGKFIIGRDGKVVKFIAPKETELKPEFDTVCGGSPDEEKMKVAIEATEVCFRS